MTPVLAFDLGLQTTGFAWPGGSDIHECPAALRRSPMTPERHEARRAWWLATFRALVLPFPGCIVAVEAPISHAKHASGQIETHMLHGVLRGVAADNGSMVVTVTPAELKRYATGSGSADKDDMLAAAVARGCEPQTHDEADAYLLWCMVTEGAVDREPPRRAKLGSKALNDPYGFLTPSGGAG